VSPSPFRPVNRSQKAMVTTLPAPVGGLNTRDALATMEPVFAVSMVDAFPQAMHVEARKGYEVVTTVTGMTSSDAMPGFVRYGDASLWVATYDASASELILKNVETAATQTITGHTVIYPPVYTQFTNSAGNFVAVVFRNGTTTNYYTYDGTTWTNRTAATTGSSGFKHVFTFDNRLWFLMEASMSAYYLPTLAITGTPIEFPLGGMFDKSTTLYAMGAWSRDGGLGGMDDLIAFVTGQGQVAIYSGIDPSSASTFAHVGTFDIPKPVGKPFKLGADLLIPTEDGLYSMNAVMGGQAEPEFAISGAVRPTWQQYAVLANENGAASSIIGRVSLAYSGKLNQLMVMFRSSGSTGSVFSSVLVMNTITKAWTEYSGINGYTVDTLRDYIYFASPSLLVDSGTTGRVYKFGAVVIDPDYGGSGSAISPIILQAYSVLDMPGQEKLVTAFKPSFSAVASGEGVTIIGTIYKDFETSSSEFSEDAFTTGTYNPVWSAPKMGTFLAPRLVVAMPTSGTTNSWKWYATSILFIPGGFV
jgi:hypothetical protein